jgi:hypothetical protein
MISKTKLLGLALGAVFTLAGASNAQAQCNESRFRHEQRELARAINHHGYYSRQAQEERNELARLSAQCDRRYYSSFRSDRDRDDRWRRDRDRDDRRHRDGDRSRDRDRDDH